MSRSTRVLCTCVFLCAAVVGGCSGGGAGGGAGGSAVRVMSPVALASPPGATSVSAMSVTTNRMRTARMRAGGSSGVTRMAAVPPGASQGPLSFSRSDDVALLDANMIPNPLKVNPMDSPRLRHFVKGRPGKSASPRRIRDRMPPHGYTLRDVVVRGPHQDGFIGSARPSLFDLALMDREDEEASYNVWERPSETVNTEAGGEASIHGGGPPDSLGDIGDIALDADFPVKQGDHHMKSPAADGRGPIVVRGPPFNSVAIGFLIYLILLAVLQNSIFNMTTKGLLGLSLKPLRDARDRGRRDMEGRVANLGLANYHHLQAPGSSDLEYTSLGHQQQPVLVAAVLDSEPGETKLGGPRRHRRHVYHSTRGRHLPQNFM